jgi:hypothetical protein
MTAHQVTPLFIGARRAIVDGHPICSTCGDPARPVDIGQWVHGGPVPDNPYLAAIGRDSLALPYRSFTLAHPWATDPGYGPVTTAEHWTLARSRLAGYFAVLDDEGSHADPYRAAVSCLTGAGGKPPIGTWRLERGVAQVLDLAERRRECASRFSWAIPSPAALATIADFGPILECAAGTGYWAALLRRRGLDVVATDAAPPDGAIANRYHRKRSWTTVLPATAVASVRAHPDRTLLLCWAVPDDDGGSHHPLRAYRGETFLHIGDGPEGPTGTLRFHRELALNWTLTDEVALPNWPGLSDRLMVWRRNAGREPLRQRDRCPECGRLMATGSIGRCERCFRVRPSALALRSGPHRLEYSSEELGAMPAALRAALEASPNRLR